MPIIIVITKKLPISLDYKNIDDYKLNQIVPLPESKTII